MNAYVDEFDRDPVRDAPNKRRLELPNNAVIATRTDPHGFIYLSLETGPTPEGLKGAFLTYPKAFEHARNYLRDHKRRTMREISEQEKLAIQNKPVLQTKKRPGPKKKMEIVNA